MSPAAARVCRAILMTAKRRVIAVVENNPLVRSAVASLLYASGYRTETFGSAKDFLAAAAASEAECLVVDIQLGDTSGVELGRQLKAAGFSFPIIFMTTSSDDHLRRSALEIGCDAYLNKFDLADRLVEELEKAIVPQHPSAR
jgi:FixJ family two-component response regulator